MCIFPAPESTVPLLSLLPMTFGIWKRDSQMDIGPLERMVQNLFVFS